MAAAGNRTADCFDKCVAQQGLKNDAGSIRATGPFRFVSEQNGWRCEAAKHPPVGQVLERILVNNDTSRCRSSWRHGRFEKSAMRGDDVAFSLQGELD